MTGLRPLLALLLVTACPGGDGPPQTDAGSAGPVGAGTDGGAYDGAVPGSVDAAASDAGTDGGLPPGADAGGGGWTSGGGDAGATDGGWTPAPDAGDAGADGGAAPTACEPAPGPVLGRASYYEPLPDAACGYADYGEGGVGVALPNELWADDTFCGACLEVTGPEGTLVVRVSDHCPDCPTGQLDLSHAAFLQVGEERFGIIDIEWRVVPCPVDGAMSYRWDEGSHAWWARLWVRSHRTPLALVELRGPDGTWRSARREWGGFVVENAGEGPFDLRLTDIYGRTVTEAGVPLAPGEIVDGSVQLPACR